MGCDGGTIPKRHELVKTKKRGEQKDKNADLAAKWKHCALSNEPLKEPIVACELGKLYNKDAVIEYLLDKSSGKKEEMSHVRGLRDIHTLKLHPNPSWQSKMKKAEKGDGYIDDQNSKYICPIAGIEMNGKHKFCYLRTCGCVLSQRALKEIRDGICGICSKGYSEADDVIILNGDDEEVKKLRENIESRKKAKKSEKSKKKSNGKVQNGLQNGHSKKCDEGPSTSGTSKNNGAFKAASEKGNVKTLEVGEALKGVKRKMEEGKIYKSETFKSLFTSHESAKRTKDQKAHWITYNPYHC